MRIAVMQPTYLPWMGYFALIQQVDAFVFLDNVEFSRQSWQQRNRIKAPSGPMWLTVPVNRKTKENLLINQIVISDDSAWRRKHYQSILHSYSRSGYLDKYGPVLESFYSQEWRLLGEFNMALIREFIRHLGIATPTYLASELNTGDEGDKVMRLIRLCQYFNATEYLCSSATREYIEANNQFPGHGISVLFYNYEHPRYRQLHGDFEPYLSVVDLLCNEGDASADIMRSGIRDPVLLSQGN